MACTKLDQFLATPSISNCLIAIFQKLVEIFSPNFHTLLHSLFPLIPSLPNILHTSYFFSYFHLNVKNFVFFPLFRASRPNFRSFAKFIQSCKNLTSGVDNSIAVSCSLAPGTAGGPYPLAQMYVDAPTKPRQGTITKYQVVFPRKTFTHKN